MQIAFQTSGRAVEIATWMAAHLFAIVLLCVPTIWNGFPLVYDDLGGYLERWPTGTLGSNRSALYGLLVWFTASGWWIPLIVLQAAATVWVIDRALAVFGLRRSPWLLVLVVAAVAATSGVAFFVSQVMPDSWTAPAFLALHLLAWHADRLTPLQRTVMAAIIAVAGASHMATFGGLIGLSVLYAAVWLFRRRLGIAPPGLLIAVTAVVFGLLLLLAANFLVAGRVVLTPGGPAFLFARLMEAGIVGKVLEKECPRDDWRLCAFRKQMPAKADDLLWITDSPFYKIGGWDDARVDKELTAIIVQSLRDHPREHLNNAISLTAAQLASVAVTHSVPHLWSWHTKWAIDRYTPWLAASYAAARQQQNVIELEEWSRWVVVPGSLGGSLLLPFAALYLWRRGCPREAMLPAAVLAALLGNAFICGVFSGPWDRYQARLVWLAPFVIALTLAACRNTADGAKRSSIVYGVEVVL